MTTAGMMDQLEARLNAAVTDTQKCAALNALVWELRAVDPHRALALSTEAVRLARAAARPNDLVSHVYLASSLCSVGVCANGLSRHDEAIQALEEGLTLSRGDGSRQTEARCLQYLGRTYYLQADFAAAIKQVTAAVAIFEEIEDWAEMGSALNILGNVYKKLGDYAKATACHVQGLEARERAGDEYGITESLINVGCVCLEIGDYPQALAFHERCLAQARRSGNPRVEALSLGNLGGDYLGLRRYTETIEFSRQAAELGAALGAAEIEAGALANIGDAYAGWAQWSEALDYYTRARVIADRAGDRDLVADLLCQMGTALTQRGEMEQARGRLAESKALAQTIGARKTASQAARALSEVCRRLGDYAAALGHHEEFYRLEKEIFTENADKHAKSLVIQVEVEHHRREAAALTEANAALQEVNFALAQANIRLESLATTDPLTGLPNHRALVAALDAETARCRRSGGTCALLFLDIDHFKGFNDFHGHPVGDAVLREFAEVVRTCLRNVDTLGRWGGEEFLVVLPGADIEAAQQIGERIRTTVAAHVLTAGQTSAGETLTENGLHMTCSIGASASPPQEPTRDSLVEAADQALYTAKRMGRNQVRLAEIRLASAPLAETAPGDMPSGSRRASHHFLSAKTSSQSPKAG